MISVVLYGRNDSYGYNLHKRAAVSLNCIAEVLTHEEDEILFVDYNTPNDFPTFPEAIQDTLTPRARRLLRILRVRPKHHIRFREHTHLPALEPVARNVAVRRSNPSNRWVLSTNTDMIFVPRTSRSLSDVAAELVDGLYHLPRFEIPESLWESLDRTDPVMTLSTIATWGWDFHLNEIVHETEPSVRFDGPGDFQLMLRADLFKIGGFNEEMLLGWHVDSNIAKRLHLIHHEVRDLIPEFFGYHCDHTRQATSAHRPDSVENDLAKYRDQVQSPYLPEQVDWGLAHEAIEELSADRTSTVYLRSLSAAIDSRMSTPTDFIVEYDRISYEASHVLPFLADTFVNYPPDTNLAWFGSRRDLLIQFAKAWTAMGFERPILVAIGAEWLDPLPPRCIWASDAQIREADIFVFDWGLRLECQSDNDSDDGGQFVKNGFLLISQAEETRLIDRNNTPRRFVCINALINRYEALVHSRIGATRSPRATRIRQGFLLPTGDSALIDVLRILRVGPAGKRSNGAISLTPGMSGYATCGPYLALKPGNYRLSMVFTCEAPTDATRTDPGFELELYSDPYLLGLWRFNRAHLASGQFDVEFTITPELEREIPLKVEFRLRAIGQGAAVLADALLNRIGAPSVEQDCIYDLSHALQTEPLVHAKRPTTSKLLAWFRPQRPPAAWWNGRIVPAGDYEADVVLDVVMSKRSRASGQPSIMIEAVINAEPVVLASHRTTPHSSGTCVTRLSFLVPRRPAKPNSVGLRISWTDGTQIAVRTLTLRRVSR